MNLSKIHHIAIIVSDYEAAKDFYVNKLGFSVIRENYRPERKDWKLDLRVNEHTELEIFAEENPPKRVNRPEACGLRHLAFCVESVEQTVNELTEVQLLLRLGTFQLSDIFYNTVGGVIGGLMYCALMKARKRL